MRILLIDDEDRIRDVLSDILQDENHTVFCAEDGIKGLEILKKEKIDLCFLDVWMPKMGGIEVLQQIKDNYKKIEVIMISGHAKIDLAVTSTKIGAYGFIEKPLSIEKILSMVEEIKNKKNNIPKQESIEQMIGESEKFKKIKQLIESASKSEARILILGENGTGKELVAREIHNNSFRSDKNFVGVNCAAIPENLIESELFGHVKGAFTGASMDRIGKFEQASGGTLFLDEIADMSLSTQAKVLRVLQEMKITKIGSSETLSIDVRIIAATNKDIKEEISNGNFREDLFYRLNVIPIRMPSLSERKDDIPLLINYFLQKLVPAKQKIKTVSTKAMEYLKNYSWPGNIRQLRNIIERLSIIIPNEEIKLIDVQKHLENVEEVKSSEDYNQKYDKYKLSIAREKFEKDFIENKLKENNYNITQTAKVLGLYPSNLHSKLSKLGIEIEKLKKS